MEKLLPEQGKAVKEEQKINGPEAISSHLAPVIKRVTTFPTRDTSQLPKIRVGQEEFGILSPEMRELGYKAIETGGIADCVGVIILDKKKGYYTLAHLDPLTAPAVLQMLFRMREEGAEGPYEIHIVTSLQSSPEAVETIKNKLQLEAKQIIIHKVPQVPVNIGVDEEGNLYSPDRIDINVSFAEGVSKILGSAAQRMAGQEPIIKYVNPQHKLEALSPSLDIHLPPDLVGWIKKNDNRPFVPVQARVHSAGEKYASYILRLPFDAPPHLVEELLSNLKGEGKLKDVKVGIDRKYKLVEVYQEGYPIEKDREVVERINKAAALIWEGLKSLPSYEEWIEQRKEEYRHSRTFFGRIRDALEQLMEQLRRRFERRR